MNQVAFPDRVREFFTLREAERESKAVPEDARATAVRGLAVAIQKREAAETLWPRGSTAEALRLAKASIDLAASTLDALGATEAPKPAWLVGARAIADGARKQIESAKLPELEADAQPGDEETFRAMIAAALEIERLTGLGLAAPSDIAATRRARVSTAAGLAVFALVVFGWWVRTPLVLHATASSQQVGGDFAPENAVDDDTKTAWLLPEKQTGWLDITVGKARSVNALHILTGNPPYNDRTAKEVHVDAYLADRVVKSTDATFPEPVGKEADWVDVPIGAKCDRIRITVRSFFKNSAGIAEVQIK
jgi:hypothetical protein